MGDSVKISVVVALYNTGEALRRLVGSLDMQSLPADQFETVLVDDGSTDDTLQVAYELAAARSNVVVKTIPNSGWPGRPRNIGIDTARGEYVFFADHDDAFGTNALAGMHEMAERTGADIVYGKVVRIGRDTPYWSVWAADLDNADVLGPVLSSRTTHKLYRRTFLVEHGLRFREGKIRLEDHEFMARALCKAGVISVLSSVPCYFWIHRTDGTNASDKGISAARYWGYYDDVLCAWQETAGPGPLLDAARTMAAMQIFSRLPARSYLARTPASRANAFAAAHGVVARHVPPQLDERFGVSKRLRVQALRDGDQERFDALQQHRASISFALRTDRLTVRQGRLHVEATARCVFPDAAAVLPDRSGARALLPLGEGIEADDTARTLSDADFGGVEITIRNRGTGVEWPVADQRVRREDDTLEVYVDATIDLSRDTFGNPLGTGSWDVLARIQFLGESLTRKVRAIPVDRGGQRLPPDVELVKDAALTFAVGRRSDQRPTALHVRWSGRRLVVGVDDAVTSILLRDREGSTPQARAPVVDGVATLQLDDLLTKGSGLLDAWAEDVTGESVRLGYVDRDVACPAAGRSRVLLYSTTHGSLSVRASAESVEPDSQKRRRATVVSLIGARVRGLRRS